MSPIRKALHAPRLNQPTPRMLELDAQAQPLEAELDHLRSNNDHGIFSPATDRVRELRRMLAEIDREHTAEFRRSNPEWVRFWSAA